MLLYKFLPVALFCAGLSLIACGDDSSSSPSNEEEAPTSSDDGQLFHLSSVAPSSSESAPESSSSQRGQFVPESSSEKAHPDKNCTSEVNANVTVENIETINIQCNGATEGWLVLMKDQNKLFTCKANNWEETLLDDC